MEGNKEQLFVRYIDYLCAGNRTFNSIGKEIAGVKLFLDSDLPVTKKGYKDFCKKNSLECTDKSYVKNSLLDFLNWKGVGFSKRKSKKKSEQEKLEKITEICDRNKKIINDFCNYLSVGTDLSEHTVYSYTHSVKQFYEYATEFNIEQCRAFIVTLESNNAAPKTINLKINALCRLGEFLKRPVALKRVKLPRVLHTENVPSLEEYNRLLDYLKVKNMNRYFDVKILATTGARISEYLQMTWENVIDGEVTLKGKGSKYRHFFFSKELIKEAREYVNNTGANGIICKNRSGMPMSNRGLSTYLKSCADHIGIDKSKLHPHAFRHFFAKMYLKKNKDIVQLAEFLGHSSIDTTKIYLQKTYDEQKKDFSKNVTW